MTILLTVNPDDWDEARDNPEGLPPGEVTRKLDEDMYPVIERARAGDDTAVAELFKRYRKYAKNFAIKYLTEERAGAKGRLSRQAAGSMADDVAMEAMARVFVGHKKKDGSTSSPAFHRWIPGQSTMATFLSAAIKNVAREGARAWKKGGRATGAVTAAGEDVVDTIAAEGPSPEDVVSADEVDEVDAVEMTQAEARRVQEAIDSGELSAQDEKRAQAMLDEWRTGQKPAKRDRRRAEREAVDVAMDTAGSSDQSLTGDEAQILGLREGGLSYKQIAMELFGTDDKKAVQKVMVRLHRARKSLERTTGMPLRGIEADLGGIGYTNRGRKRKNPELVIYFEDVTDLDELLQAGILDPAGYQACLSALLECLGHEDN